jgi:hypothetical protein
VDTVTPNATVEKSEAAPPSGKGSAESVVRAIENLVLFAVGDGVGDPRACEQQLRHVLASDELVSLEARDAFEAELILALATQAFKNASGAMLVASADVFEWRLGQFSILHRCGEYGQYIERLLDEEAWIKAGDLRQWLRLDAEPGLRTLAELVAQRLQFQSTCPQLYAFCYSEAQRDAWRIAAEELPAAQGQVSRSGNFDHLPYFFQVLLRLVWIPIVFGVIGTTIWGIGTLGDRQEAAQLSGCSSVYQKLASQDWRNVDVSQLTSVKNCAEKQPPALCSDRRELIGLFADAQRLYPGNPLTYFYYGMPDVRLHTDAGLGFELKESANCYSVMQVLTESNWMGFGDEQAAAALVRQASRCDAADLSQPAKNQLLFLKQLDVWPDASGGKKKNAIPLERLVFKEDIDNHTVVFDSQKSWPTCLSDPKLR